MIVHPTQCRCRAQDLCAIRGPSQAAANPVTDTAIPAISGGSAVASAAGYARIRSASAAARSPLSTAAMLHTNPTKDSR